MKFKGKKLVSFLLVCTLSVSICSCGKITHKNNTAKEDTPITEAASKEQDAFDNWLLEQFKEDVSEDSLSLNFEVAHPESYGIEPPKATLGDADMSEASVTKYLKENSELIEELKTFDYDLLSERQKYDYDVCMNLLLDEKNSAQYRLFSEPFAYTSGLQANVPIMFAEYTFYTKDDIDTYIEILSQIDDYYGKALEFEKEKAEKGFFMSTGSANSVIEQCEEFAKDPENNLLIATFDSRIDEFEGLTDAEKTKYKETNKNIVLNEVIPCYKNVARVFGDLKKFSVNQNGLAHFDQGKEYYKVLLRNTVGSDKTPEEVITLLDERIEDITALIQQEVFSDYEAVMEYFNNAENIFADVTDQKQAIDALLTKIDKQFPEMPQVNFKVSPVHPSLEKIVSPAFYMIPPIDLYTENSIYINGSLTDNSSIWNTLAHEGIPGHMYQSVYYRSTNPAPERTILNFSGYVEGWATYAEMLSFDMYDKYPNETCARLARYNNEFNLLLSARIEIGVNYEGWTLEDTTNYLNESGLDGSAAENIFTYVSSEPVNYQEYVLGWLEFEELKDTASSKLGDKFDEKEFHKVILEAGPSQFYLLRDKVNDYIDHASSK